MAKLYQILEQTFKMRINSNAEIIPYIKKLSEMGKFDEPKKIAAIAILLDRLAKLEDEADMTKSLSDIASSMTKEPSTPQETPPEPSSEVVGIEEKPIIDQNTPVESVSSPSEPITENLNPASEVNPSTPDSQPLETTVSEFTAENITDPTPSPTPDSTIA